MNRKSAPKRLLSKLWKWLKSKLVGAAKTIYLGGRNYLTGEEGEIQKVREEEVEEKHRAKKDVDSEKPVDEMIRQARVSKMDDLHSLEVARRANDNRMIKADVLDNPDLVDAGSEWEAQLKLDLADGEDISSRVDSNPKISEADIESELGTEWIAKWGDNVGDVEAMMNGEADVGDSVDADADADGSGATGSTGETGDLGHASADGAPTVQASNVGSTASSSTGSSGSSTGTGSSSGAGSAGNSAGSGHATGGGNSVSASSFSAGTSN